MVDLIENGTLSEKTAGLLREKVGNRQNILISGGTGSGKTTLLNILADSIPDDERILLIEDTAELNIRKSNLVRFEICLEAHEILWSADTFCLKCKNWSSL
jgi:pilus assembly protein CpaF